MTPAAGVGLGNGVDAVFIGNGDNESVESGELAEVAESVLGEWCLRGESFAGELGRATRRWIGQ